MDSEMLRISVKLLALICWLSTEFRTCSSEEFTINRDKEVHHSIDAFTIPPSKCDANNSTFDHCAEYKAGHQRGKGPCECVCRKNNATFAFKDDSWSCQDNTAVRTLLGCNGSMLFHEEQSREKLNLLRNDSSKRIDWSAGECTLKLSSYIGCHGETERVSFSAGQMFKIDWENKENLLEVELSDSRQNTAVTGRVVKIEISCRRTSDSTTENGCLLFKLEGTTNCPVKSPQTTPTSATIVDRVVNTPLTVPEILSPPNSAADQQAKGINSLSVGLIIGLTASITAIIFIVGIFVYRQRYARKHPYVNTEGHNSHSKHGSQHGEENAGYATLSARTTSTSASGYQVPFTNGGMRTFDSEEPLYSTVDEYRDPAITEGPNNDRPLSVEQRVYNLIEGLDTSTPDGPYDYSSLEGSQVQAPPSVEQRVYNIIEVLHTDTSDIPHDNASDEGGQASQGPLTVEQGVYSIAEVPYTDPSDSPGPFNGGSQTQAPMSVEQRVYNIMEPLDTQNREQPNSCDPEHKEANKQPVYNVLEDPLPNDTDDVERKGSSSVKDPVYNALESPNPGKTEEPNNVSLDTSHEYEEPN